MSPGSYEQRAAQLPLVSRSGTVIGIGSWGRRGCEERGTGDEDAIERVDKHTDVIDDRARKGLQLLEIGIRDGRGEALQTGWGLGAAVAEIGWNGCTFRTLSYRCPISPPAL